MELVVGIAVGILLGALLFRPKPVGNLRVDQSDDRPYLIFESEVDIGYIMRKKRVTLRVRLEDYLPHE